MTGVSGSIEESMGEEDSTRRTSVCIGPDESQCGESCTRGIVGHAYTDTQIHIVHYAMAYGLT